MERDLETGKLTPNQLLTEPQKVLAVRYKASRDTVHKARAGPVETRSEPKEIVG